MNSGGAVAKLDLVANKATWWTVNLRGSSYGDIKIGGSFKYAILDTGTSLIGLEQSSFDLIKDEVQRIEGAECYDGLGCALPGDCASYEGRWPIQDLKFQLNYNVFTLPPAAYTFTISDNADTEACLIAVQPLPENTGVNILGDPFLRTFTTTFDYASQQMQLSINVNAPAGTKIEKLLSPLEYFGIGLVVVVLIAILIAIACCCYRAKKKRDEEAKYKVVLEEHNESLTDNSRDNGAMN